MTRGGNDFARNTNIPRDFAAAAKKLGMKYGFYISPWDRNSALYGTDKYVSDVFLRQCAELAQYGTDQFEMWFDGANGGDGYYGGANDRRSIDNTVYYDIPNLRDSVHKVCPDCVLWGVVQSIQLFGGVYWIAGAGSAETVSLSSPMLWTFPMLDKSSFLTEHFNHGFAYWIYALMAILSALFMWKFVPETKGKTLEEMNNLVPPKTK